jgi:hypothetical protein
MDAATIERCYRQHRSLSRVYAEQGIKRHRAWEVLQAAGIAGATDLRRRYRIELAVDRIMGESTPAIARRCGVHRSRVHRWMLDLHPGFFKIINRGIFSATVTTARRHPRKAGELRAWLRENLLTLLEQEALAQRSRPTLTTGEEGWLSRQTEFAGDFRDAEIDARRLARDGSLARFYHSHRFERAG